ncbi:MAG: hypothetical protein AAF682_04565 [Planctomycetota bacterium]
MLWTMVAAGLGAATAAGQRGIQWHRSSGEVDHYSSGGAQALEELKDKIQSDLKECKVLGCSADEEKDLWEELEEILELKRSFKAEVHQ